MGKFHMYIESEEQVKPIQDLLMKLYYQKRLSPEDVASMSAIDLLPIVADVTGAQPGHRELAMIRQVAANM